MVACGRNPKMSALFPIVTGVAGAPSYFRFAPFASPFDAAARGFASGL